MNLQDVQELKKSISEIRNDENLEQMFKHLQNLGSENQTHQEITVKLALESFNNFKISFDDKMQKIENVFSQFENMLQQNP